MKHLYVAEDGTQFDNEGECLSYEGIPFIRLFAGDEELDIKEDMVMLNCQIAFVPHECRDEFNRLCRSSESLEAEFSCIDDYCDWIYWDEDTDTWRGLSDDVVATLYHAVPIVRK